MDVYRVLSKYSVKAAIFAKHVGNAKSEIYVFILIRLNLFFLKEVSLTLTLSPLLLSGSF